MTDEAIFAAKLSCWLANWAGGGGPPVRLCCGLPHYGAQCPDGLVMCCVCFDRVPVDQLMVDDDGTWDICRECADRDARSPRPVTGETVP